MHTQTNKQTNTHTHTCIAAERMGFTEHDLVKNYHAAVTWVAGFFVAVCCSVLQYGAVCCSVLQCVAVWEVGFRFFSCRVLQGVAVPQCVTIRCSALQYGTVRCSMVQCVAERCSVLQYVAMCVDVTEAARYFVAVCCSELPCVALRGAVGEATASIVAVWCSVLQCGAVCCSMVQCVAEQCRVLQCEALWERLHVHVTLMNESCHTDQSHV